MHRRDAVLALATLGTCVPLVCVAQGTKTRSIGIIFATSEENAKPVYEAMLAGLRDYGYVPDKNVIVHARYAGGDPSRFPALADEMIALKVDLILTFDTVAAVLKQKTTTLPIVMFNSADPVALGLVQSFARPRGNVTGMTGMWDQTIPKHVEMLLEIVPKMSRLALLYDDSIDQRLQELHLQMARTTAQAKGLTVIPVKWSKPDELQSAFDTIAKARPDALLLVPTFNSFNFRRELASGIRRLRVPSTSIFFANSAMFQESGALLGYGAHGPDQARRATRYVDQILKGANPGDLPIEQFGIYRLRVNLAVARELSLKVPPSVMARADDVIE